MEDTMKKRATFLTLIAIFAFVFSPVLGWCEMQDMWADVYADTGKINASGRVELTKITSGITYKVLAVNADTSETLYVYDDQAFTSLTNPVTTTNFNSPDRVQFRTDPTDSSTDRYVDLIVVDTAGGYTAFVEDFDKYTHTIVIDERPNIQHHGVIWWSYSSAVEVDTGIDFDYDTRIEGVSLEVVTVDASATVDVGLLSTGTNGDADGFLDGVSTTTAGIPLVTLTTSGALMDDGTNFDPDGHSIISANEQSLTYTGSSGSDTGYGYIHYFFTRMR